MQAAASVNRTAVVALPQWYSASAGGLVQSFHGGVCESVYYVSLPHNGKTPQS
ncbi:hypothetical protein KCP75_21210 [Salmonella enterica subsp. enterica]|nr:hypothetical protein KCP75_21210 [Salmonella enterica subsp. enterica]